MMENLHKMTNAELKKYLSQYRNDEEAFRAGLQVLMSRRGSETVRQPYPFDLANPETEVEGILRKKLEQSE